ncbi:MAG: hypothetical protein WAV25_02425 [Minisyncoccia bacterium]
MRRQALKDQLLKQLESNWAGFVDEVSEIKARLNNKLDEFAKIYGAEVVRTLLKQKNLDFHFLPGEAAPTAAAAKPTKDKKITSAKATPKKIRRRRKMHFSKEGLASRKLQGVYLNLLNKMPKGDKAKYKKLARGKNRQVAINAMKSFLNK